MQIRTSWYFEVLASNVSINVVYYVILSIDSTGIESINPPYSVTELEGQSVVKRTLFLF